MINTLAQIDFLASSGRTGWHRASALSKLLLTALVVLVAVFAPRLPLQLALLGAAAALALTSRLPLRLVLGAALYPLLVAGLFALLRWDGDVLGALRLVLRPVTATLAAVWLVGTTPYPDLFAPLSRALPRSVGDGLFLTYRSLFLLLARIERLFRAMHLRGGDGAAVNRRLPLAGEGLATVVLHGFERSQRLYATMLLRGHSGRICGCRHWTEPGAGDLWVALAGAAVLALAAAMWRAA